MTTQESSALPLGGLRRHSLALRSLWLMLGRCLQMGSGFLFWVVAARAASVADVGVAAACVSAVMLCTQLGILGAGSAVIIALGRGEPRSEVLDTAFSVVLVTAGLAGSGYLLFVALGGGVDLRRALSVAFVALFLLAVVAGTVVICLDQVSIAVHRTEGAAVRYTVGGLGALGAVVLVTLAAGVHLTATQLLSCWALGSVGALATGTVQLRRWVGYRYRPRVRLRRVTALVRVGVPNQLLTLTERLAPAMVPIILAHTVSPTMTAYWYPAWMMAWVGFTAPISVGMVQFADIVRHPERVREVMRQGMLWSLLIGGAIGAVLAAGAPLFLSLLGHSYAEASVTALRLLTIGIFPFLVLQAYNAVCRAVRRTKEAIVLGALMLAAVCGGTVAWGSHGTTAVALVWIGSSGVAATWALWRISTIMRRLPHEPSPEAPGGADG